MTNQTPPYPGTPTNNPPKRGGWSAMKPGVKAGIIIAALLLPCFGSAAAIGAVAVSAGDPHPTATATAARQLADGGATTAAPTTAAPTAPSATPSTVVSAPVATTAAPVIEKRMVTESRRIAFSARKVRDSSLSVGVTKVRTKGVTGIRTSTYEVTLVDGKQTGRKLMRTVVTRRPVTKVVAVGTKPKPQRPQRECDPNYGGCVPVASDVDCAGGSGNGPAYVSGSVKVIGSDIYDLDRDGDGYGCDD